MATVVQDTGSGALNGDSASASTFAPADRTKSHPSIGLPDELWITVLENSCTFDPTIFSGVMLNLIKNPNITASHLFRADIFYDSENDHKAKGGSSLLSQLKAEYRPIDFSLPNYELTRTIVRQLVPRNPQLDAPLVQTCHFFTRLDGAEEHNIVVYIPHVDRAEDVPFYHPAVSMLAFEHTWRSYVSGDAEGGSISISYRLFPSTSLTTKLERTALRLLQTVHKHGQGQLAGYQKRVHLDQVVPQKRYQDTYTRLKTKYGKQLAEQWVEVTDPGKHVFEDIGIAAFLIELWRDMYASVEATADDEGLDGGNDGLSRARFPGFVDIGCGNGVLAYILLAEGYEGWGFDARERKTWSIFPENVRERLQRRLLIPAALNPGTSTAQGDEEELVPQHPGIFPQGTFIISNHADELTTWTPLLAYLNRSAFIAIPCCSHDLSGSRFRAPASTKQAKAEAVRLPQQCPENGDIRRDGPEISKGQAAETGSLKRTEAQKKMPSAYSTLCSYVESLAEDLGFATEREVLRIPSTRNQCIIGRRRGDGAIENDDEVRAQKIVEVIERELGKSVNAVGGEWISRAEKLAKKPGSGH